MWLTSLTSSECSDLCLVDADLSILDCIFTKKNMLVSLDKNWTARGLKNLTSEHVLLSLLLLHS